MIVTAKSLKKEEGEYAGTNLISPPGSLYIIKSLEELKHFAFSFKSVA